MFGQQEEAPTAETRNANKPQNATLKMMTKVQHALHLYKELHSNIITNVFAKKNKDTQKMQESDNKIQSILESVYQVDEETKDIFMRQLISEYKENVYESVYDPCYEAVEMDILCKYDSIMDTDKLYTELCNHEHDPTHFMYEEGGGYYDFYDRIEKNGGSVLEVYYTQE